ncbi:alpha/beta hydrolase [Spirilliplanes yamanashiensis]|uniref:Hydrolase n=1 Tax=Spirilliplanes yamanashiensis TaxID=42233 RepID=A0A8J3YDH7_9ACTN|nr:alpha/beta hydrolase [Spirilliplanes yamanashiensis]MDP9818231.1 pimeloyl-ACP methyl ester carboxylesterase [Spirilliplanes yamanashiensis]GIJ06741.1 hydrolase [Spirilliplanes yamanashiensis]
MIRRLATIVTATAVAAATAAAPPAPARGTAPPAAPALAWVDCQDGFECATARVPLDHDRPAGPTIRLAVVRLPATDPARRIGSLFINPGGPGESGVEFLRAAGPALYSAEVRARFDLVSFDPRGVLASSPLRCFDTLDQALASRAPIPTPVTRAEERAWVRHDRALADACAKRGGPIMHHMATANVARDLELLRRAVGDRQLTFAGYSYGSYLGQTYANLFPGRVRAIVIDGIIDPVGYATGRAGEGRTVPFQLRQRQDQGVHETLQEFFRLCDLGGATCAFSAGDPRRRFARLAARLRAAPVRLPDGSAYTYNELVYNTAAAMSFPEFWPLLAQLLDALDSASAPAGPAAARRALDALRAGPAGGAGYPNVVEGGPAVLCTDTDNPRHAGAWARTARAADRRHPYVGRPVTWYSSICAQWPGRDRDRYTGPWSAATAHPVLVVGTRFDGQTRYQNAVIVSRLLPNARLLTNHGWGHTSRMARSACVDRHTSRYLLTTRPPPAGTVCGPDVIPFAPPPAG